MSLSLSLRAKFRQKLFPQKDTSSAAGSAARASKAGGPGAHTVHTAHKRATTTKAQQPTAPALPPRENTSKSMSVALEEPGDKPRQTPVFPTNRIYRMGEFLKLHPLDRVAYVEHLIKMEPPPAVPYVVIHLEEPPEGFSVTIPTQHGKPKKSALKKTPTDFALREAEREKSGRPPVPWP